MAAVGAPPPWSEPCFPEVELQVVARSYQLSPGLLALAVLLGVALGCGAAALLWCCAVGPRLLLMLPPQPKKDDSQRLVEGNPADLQDHLCEDCDPLPERMEGEIWRATQTENPPPLEMNVTQFALKAKVIYPINQKFRPLADGASNPSLRENPKQAILPNQVLELSTSSSLESLSQGGKEDGASSTTINSAARDERDQDQTFFKVTCFPEVLLCDILDSKMCLYSLLLKHLHLLDMKLRKEKHTAVLHIFRMFVANLYRKKKIPEDLYHSILRTQETACEELQKQLHSRLLSTEIGGACDLEYQTLDDLERKERDYSDHILDNMDAFWKWTDEALSSFLDQAQCSSVKANKIKIMTSLTEKIITVEQTLKESQDFQTMDIQARMFNWEQLVQIVNLLKAQIREEGKCRLNSVSNTLDQLTKRNSLTMKQREEFLAGIHKALGEKVEHYEEECIQLSKALIQKHLMNRTKNIECLAQAQEDELRNLLSQNQQVTNLDAFLKAYHEMAEQQRKAQRDLEEKSDWETIGAVADVYTELYSRYSHHLEDLVAQMFLQTLPPVAGLPLRDCELLQDDLREHFILQLEKLEKSKQKHWTFFQEQLQREKELWMKERALGAVMQNRLSATNEKIIQCVLNRLGGLSKESSKYVSQKHKSLLNSVLRRLAFRHDAMSTLAQMRIARTRSILLELKERHMVQVNASHCLEEHQWKRLKKMESHILEEEEKLENEVQQTRLEFHQQLVAETQESLQFLQQHMELVIGRALLQQARQKAAEHDTDGREDFKEMLQEAVVESVYVTSGGVNRLIKSYREQLAKLQEGHKGTALKSFQEIVKCDSCQRRQDCRQSDRKGPANSFPAVLERMLAEGKRTVALFEVQQQTRLVSSKQKMLLLSNLETELENELMKAEQQFVTELAAMARLPVPVHKAPLQSAIKSGKKRKPKQVKPQQEEREDCSKDTVSDGQASKPFRNTLPIEIGPVKNPKKLLEKRNNS